jgi:hypothetical protein
MKYLPRVLLVVVLLTSLNALANSVNYTNLSVYLTIYPNVFGDNVIGEMVGTNVNLLVGGGTAGGWFDGGPTGLYSPGSVGGGQTTIYFDDAEGTVGGLNYDGSLVIVYGAALFNAGVFTFPTNGRDFTVSMPATLGLVAVQGCTGSDMCTTYNLIPGPGTLVLSYTYCSWCIPGGVYYASTGYFSNVPEPGTLGLVAIGISAFALCRRKLMRASR